MYPGEIAICNVALARLGCETIRDFDEDNKAARLCKVLYPFYRDRVLENYTWGFARKIASLTLLDDTNSLGSFVYQRPSDCLMPIDILPLGSKDKWYVVGNTIVTDIESAELFYTFQQDNPETFNFSFRQALVAVLMAALAPGMVQDKGLAGQLMQEAKLEEALYQAKDANTGSEYRVPDDDPNQDTFVTGGYTSTET